MKKRNIKITKREHFFKDYASSSNVQILKSFNPELKLNVNESAIKSKLIELLTQLKGFKFMATLVLVFIQAQKQK